ncbi:hypothetical protein KGQ20_32130 [Catenulispora sp. NF23]|uniref:WXG100 family type VII secretion target n=1 Tax=Catenulispora pinistramenti TaxID=2705254 RepID=A0ABS5KZW3_9ACTN|nr:hypothetical protein [Catenulispora pinistramenti]MBS2537412.1 hypothetical protein [Catenulispora pinistramenti]MBS2551445.1 hypothetical protein [Catenulispora pinistramenti]
MDVIHPGAGTPTPPAPPPPKNSDTSSGSSQTGCGFTLHVQVKKPPGTGAMYDDGAAPTTGKGLAGYTWNQAITAITGGLGDGSYGGVAAGGTWSNPQTMETAHYAILSIRAMLENYVTAVNNARDSILQSWSGPAADAFKATLKSFTDYIDALSTEMNKYNAAGPNNLLHIAHMNEAMSNAAGFIWGNASYGDGHDRNTPVTLSGDLTYDGTMVGAGQQMLIAYDAALTALNE